MLKFVQIALALHYTHSKARPASPLIICCLAIPLLCLSCHMSRYSTPLVQKPPEELQPAMPLPDYAQICTSCMTLLFTCTCCTMPLMRAASHQPRPDRALQLWRQFGAAWLRACIITRYHQQQVYTACHTCRCIFMTIWGIAALRESQVSRL